MKLKTVLALGGAAFSVLLTAGGGQAQSPRRPAYNLTYLALPDTSHPGRLHWRWVLHPVPGQARSNGELEFVSLQSPLLRASVGRLPTGSTLGLAWPFKMSDFALQPGLPDLQRLCKRRGIGMDVLYLGSR